MATVGSPNRSAPSLALEAAAPPVDVERCTRCTRPATHYVKDEAGVTEGVAGDLLCGRHASKCGLPTRTLPTSAHQKRS